MSKTLVERLVEPSDREGIVPLEIEGSRYQYFKSLFAKSGKMAKINLWAVLFALPAIIWFFYAYLYRYSFNTSINYSGNLGLGFAMVEDAMQQGDYARFLTSVIHHAILAATIVIAFWGFGGALYAVRKLAQGDERVSKSFFKGLRVTFADFFMYGIFAAVVIYIFAMSFSVFDAYGLHAAWRVIGIIITALLLLITIGFLMYATTQTVFYKNKLISTIKNSILLATKIPFQTVVFTLLGVFPFAVLYFTLPQLFLNANDTFVTLLTTMCIALFLFLGIAFVATVWTVFTDYIFELGFGAKKATQKVESKKSDNKRK